MPIVADAAAAIRADMSPFQKDFAKGMNTADTQAKGLGKSLSSALNPKSLLLGVGGGILGSQVINFLADATNAAAEFEDSVAATGVIFGEEFIPQMEAWGESAAENFGASKQEALAAANVIATLGKSAGLAGQELVGFSQEMVQLGGDLASMFGGTTQEAITAVGAALRGESEPIRRYGVLLDDATLRQRAFEMGLISTTKNALTPQQRVLAAHAEILSQTSDAQGDFSRTSDGMANTQRALAAEFENLRIEIGEQMLPIMVELARFVKDTLLPAISGLIELTDGSSESWEGFARIMDQVTLQQGKVQDVMKLTNGTYMESREIIKDWNEETGESADVLVALIEKHGSVEAALESVDAALLRNKVEHTDNALRAEQSAFRVERAYGEQERAASDLSAKTEEEMAEIAKAAEEAHEAAVQEISDMFDELIGLFSKDDFEQAVEDFHEMLNDPWPDTRRRASIEATLASDEVAEGLRSKDSSVRAETIEFVNGLIEQYETMAPGALAAGELVNPELQEGLQRNLAQTLQVAEGIAIATGNELDFREWAEEAGLSGLLSFNQGMSAQRSAAVTTAQGLAKAARDELYFDASAGGAASGWTFVNGLAGVLGSWEAATRLQNAAQLLKLRSLGGSLPIAGPFSKGPLEAGAVSIGEYWTDALGNTLSRGLTGLQFTPGMGRFDALPQLAPAAATVTPAAAGQAPVNVYGDVNVTTEEDSALDELRRLADFGRTP